MIVDGKEWTKWTEFSAKFEYLCQGGSIAGVVKPGPSGVVGTMMTTDRGLKYPDCRCENYLDAVEIMEKICEG